MQKPEKLLQGNILATLVRKYAKGKVEQNTKHVNLFSKVNDRNMFRILCAQRNFKH